MEVLYLDNHLLVVNKPAGQPIQEDRTGDPDLLTEAKAFIGLEFKKPGNVFVGLVHRLDRPVSGVVVLARTSKAASRISEQFRRRSVTKEYIALVEGRVFEGAEINSYLRKEGTRVKTVKQHQRGAKEASLRYEPLAVYGKRSLVRILPSTGRPHQIRVQLSREGFPVLGDLKYGSSRKFHERDIALHCLTMTLVHPVKKETYTWRAPLPHYWPEEARQLLSDL